MGEGLQAMKKEHVGNTSGTPKRARGKKLCLVKQSRGGEELAEFVAAVPQEERVLITECPDGYVVLGVYYGPTAANKMYEKLLDAEDDRSLAYKLAGLDVLLESKLNYEAWLLLLFCVAPSVGYVQRCAPPSETLRMATTADDLLRSYVARIASLPEGCFNNPRVRGQVHLSNKHGGPNIRSAEAANNFAYTASLADFGAECCLRWPHTKPVFDEASRSAEAPPDPNPEAIAIEQDDRAAWLKDLAS